LWRVLDAVGGAARPDARAPARFRTIAVVVATEPDLTGVLLEERYRVGPLLAVGGMSRVYRGTDLRLDREVAIKVMDPRLAADPKFRGRFEREARAIARLDHPGIIDVYDQGEHGAPPDPVVFLVMELVVGGTLRDVLRERGALPVPEALAVLEAVLGAVATAHAQGMTHRDVKPENVLISRSGAVKVADFGLVTAAAQANPSTAGMIVGTVAYLSPEQVTGHPVDARGDVYSAGILLYELLTGTPPYNGEHAISVAYQHVNQDVPPPSATRPGLPASVDALVIGATRRNPEARPADAETMLHALRGVRAALGIPKVPVPIPGASDGSLARSPALGTAGPSGASGGLGGAGGAGRVGATGGWGERTDPMGDDRRAPLPSGFLAAGGVDAGAGESPGDEDGQWDGEAWTAPKPTRALTTYSPLPAGPTGAPPFGPAGPGYDHAGRRRRSRRTLAIWIGAVLTLAALIGLLAWNAGAGRWSAMPNVVGLDQASAEHLVGEAGLVAQVRQAPDNGAPAGTVAAATPDPGTTMRTGSTVELTVSTGRPRVPAIAPGTAVADARRLLRDAGLIPREDTASYAPHPSAPPGTVIGTSPGAGSVLPVSSPVTLVISSGPARHQRDEEFGESIAELLQRQLDRALRGGG
jgi:tRNA A-37 threonylcarbamoyl transferase component Bud32